MLIKNKSSFSRGLVMTAVFVAVLAAMFLPIFDNENAFRAADKLFNTISKGSTYYVPMLVDTVAPHRDGRYKGIVKLSPDVTADVKTVLTRIGARVSERPGGLEVAVGFDRLFTAVLLDVENMFHNHGAAVRERYGIPEKRALYAWWNGLSGVARGLAAEKRFAEAHAIGEVLDRGVAVGYNYYKVPPSDAGDRWALLTFALVFYVAYTLWWGFAVFFLFEGVGLQLTAGRKKEI